MRTDSLEEPSLTRRRSQRSLVTNCAETTSEDAESPLKLQHKLGGKKRASPQEFIEDKLNAMANAHPNDFSFRTEGDTYVFEAHQRVRSSGGDNAHWLSLNFDQSITCCKTWVNFRRQLISHLYTADSDLGGQQTKQRPVSQYFRYTKPVLKPVEKPGFCLQ
jgi:hypothetical protein